MVIDLILDRKDGKEYNPEEFYKGVRDYGQIGWDITEAMDEGEEKDVKRTLKNYIIDNEYNDKIAEYIDTVDWL